MSYISKINTKGVSYNIAGTPRSIKVTTLAGLPCSGNEHIEATLSGATEFSVGAGMQPGDRTVVTCIPNSSFTQRINGKDYQIKNKRKFKIYILCISSGVYSTVVIESMLDAVYEYTPISMASVQPGDLYFADGFDKPENAGKHNPNSLIGIVAQNLEFSESFIGGHSGPPWIHKLRCIYIINLRELIGADNNLKSRQLVNTTIPLTSGIYNDRLPVGDNGPLLFYNKLSAYASAGKVHGYSDMNEYILTNHTNILVDNYLKTSTIPDATTVNFYITKHKEHLITDIDEYSYTVSHSNYFAEIYTLNHICKSEIKNKIISSWNQIKTQYSKDIYWAPIINNNVIEKLYQSQVMSVSLAARMTNGDGGLFYERNMSKSFEGDDYGISRHPCTIKSIYLPIICIYEDIGKMDGYEFPNVTFNITPPGATLYVDGEKIEPSKDGIYSNSIDINNMNIMPGVGNIINWNVDFSNITRSGVTVLKSSPNIIDIRIPGNYDLTPAFLPYKSFTDIHVGDVMLKGGGIVDSKWISPYLQPSFDFGSTYLNIEYILNITGDESIVEAVCTCVDTNPTTGKKEARFFNLSERFFRKALQANPYTKLAGGRDVFTPTGREFSDMDWEFYGEENNTSHIQPKPGCESFIYHNNFEMVALRDGFNTDEVDSYIYKLQKSREEFNILPIAQGVRDLYKKYNFKLYKPYKDVNYYVLPTPDACHMDLDDLFRLHYDNISIQIQFAVKSLKLKKLIPDTVTGAELKNLYYWVNIMKEDSASTDCSGNYLFNARICRPGQSDQGYYSTRTYEDFAGNNVFYPQMILVEE